MAKILVVDDEATITTQLEERLEYMGYQVVGSAGSGAEAVDKARELHPDLILMDIVMPGKLDGIEAARLIKKEMDIPVVFLTAYGDDRFIQRAKEVEPYGYIIKPYQEGGLRASIEIALYNREILTQLRSSEGDWKQLAENLEEAVFLSDGQGSIFFWNRGAEDIFGYTPDEAIGKKLTELMSEGTDKKMRDEILQLLSTGESDLTGSWLEIVGIKKDFSRFPLEISLAPWAFKGETSLIGIARDITSQRKEEALLKASLHEKEKDLKDIQERVKTHMRVIYSLINLQFEYLKDQKKYPSPAQGLERIQTLSRLQEKVYDSPDIARINFGTYVENLVRRLLRSYRVDESRVQIDLKVNRVYVNMRTAIPSGLILSELVSNSLRHAFPSGKKGRIQVEFAVLEDTHHTLIVKDNGIGFPRDLDFRATETQGLQIVNDLVAQLKGKIRLDRRGGTTFKITY
jgi:PAS domain S-box-containing protein